MRNNSTVARAIAASLVLGASAFAATASLGGYEQNGLIHVNYPACMENPVTPVAKSPKGQLNRATMARQPRTNITIGARNRHLPGPSTLRFS
jgi:hypothetical protein